ncbi:MAG: hypothetical protein ACI4OA_03420, partial [Selenomonadaceae bacterium]
GKHASGMFARANARRRGLCALQTKNDREKKRSSFVMNCYFYERNYATERGAVNGHIKRNS